MSIKFINVGSTANDNTGSTLRAGGQLLNNNFSVLINHLSTTGTGITLNTASTPSNTFLTSTFVSNTHLKATHTANSVVFSTFAQNTATIALVNDRYQVANVNTLLATKEDSTSVWQNAFSGESYSTVPNYGAAVTYDISANGSSGYIVSNMGFDVIGNNPALTVRNQSTVAFDLNGLGGAHPFVIRDVVGNYSNTLIHVDTDGSVSTGASAQGKMRGVLYWQIPHNLTATGNAFRYQCTSHSAMKGNVIIKDTGAI